MRAYIDSSVLLRIILGQPGALPEWASIRVGLASRLIEVECLRTLDCLRLRQKLNDRQVASARAAVFDHLAAMGLIELTPAVLSRAGAPFPTVLSTLDALHLATALEWVNQSGEPIVMATHDLALGQCARALGMPAIGC